MTLEHVFMIVGFLLAAYSIVANDAIQTLGTFLSSNSKRHWTVLWVYACGIFTVVMVWTYITNDGDLTYGKLGSIFKDGPRSAVTWLHVIPPLLILGMTRFGWPVSTTFLVLTVFANKALGPMLIKSALGYVVAVGVGFAVYMAVAGTVERHFLKTRNKAISPVWMGLQWVSTGWLWSQWLIQDLANIFVFLPYDRKVVDGRVVTSFSLGWFLFALAVMWGLHAIIFANRGGSIQKIVTSKTSTIDIRSATIVDFLYGTILFIFKEMSRMPMSTTWVFIGLLAGRELAMTIHRLALRTPKEVAKAEGRELATDDNPLADEVDHDLFDSEADSSRRRFPDTGKIVGFDLAKATAGLVVSVALAFTLPMLYRAVHGVDLIPPKKAKAGAEAPGASAPAATTHE